MIKGIHGMFYSSEPEAFRAFVRDKLALPFTDVGDGWLIFDLPEGDVGCHPVDHPNSPPSGTHDVSFYCDDLPATVKTLTERGVEFLGDIRDEGFGWTIQLMMPGNVRVQIYQPRYAKGRNEP